MIKSPIVVVGAGLSGLTLARCLRNRGIDSIVFEKSSASKQSTFGITLNRKAYQPLMEILGLDETEFRQKFVVNAGLKNTNHASITESEQWSSYVTVQRKTLENFLREGLDIKWEHTISELKHDSARHSTTLSFQENDQSRIATTVLVGCDGVHSTLRKSLYAAKDDSNCLKVLPYVVFTGTRLITQDHFQKTYTPYIDTSARLSICFQPISTVLQIQINEVTETGIKLRYIYSRPRLPSPKSDALHDPDRPKSGATTIPDEFYSELSSLPPLPPPFDDAFDIERVKADRLLHWLMRSSFVPHYALRSVTAEKRVIMIGDAIHAEPILGGEGANNAICDAVELADHIARSGLDPKNLAEFYSDERLRRWNEDVGRSERALEMMHEGR